MSLRLVSIFSLVVAVVASATVAFAESKPSNLPTDHFFQYEWVGVVEETIPEPSGLVYHPERRTLFCVYDKGTVYELTLGPSGKGGLNLGRRAVIKNTNDIGGDLEGITWDADRDVLLVALEREDAVLEVDVESLSVTRRIGVERTLPNGEKLDTEDNEGFEAICWLPAMTDTAGNTTPSRLLVANQSYSVDQADNPSGLLEINLPSAESGEKASITAVHSFAGVADLAAMHYDNVRERLYVVSDAGNLLMEVEPRTMSLSNWWIYSFCDQEGLAMDPDGFMYIAQDIGGIVKVKWLR